MRVAMAGLVERWVRLFFRVVRVGISNFPTTAAGRTKRQTIAFGREMVGSLSKGVENREIVALRVCGDKTFAVPKNKIFGRGAQDTYGTPCHFETRQQIRNVQSSPSGTEKL
jgi:hypothetical protein